MMKELSLEELTILAKQFIPTFVYHSNEKYNPCNVEEYIKECDLVDKDTNTVVMEKPLTNARVYQSGFNHPSGRYNIAIRDGTQNKIIYGVADIHLDDNVSILVHGVSIDDITYIQYIPFYAYNGPSSILGGVIWMGQHEADIEHVTAVLDKDSTLQGYYLSRHGEEKYIDIDDLTTDPEYSDRILIYCARGSHAHYSTSGSHRRSYGCSYDITNTGKMWRPKHLHPIFLPTHKEFDPASMGFMNIVGYMGDGWNGGSVSNLCLKKWFINGHDDVVDTEYLTDDKMITTGRDWIRNKNH